MSRFLVTGGTGFSGSHLVEELLCRGHEVIVLDCLTYAGPLRNLAHLASPRLEVVYHDFSQPLPELSPVDYVIHNGAESHVLRSLNDPGLFVRSNVIGTLNVLEWARMWLDFKKFVYVSTDEVFGPAGERPWEEGDALRPTNPYSATKTGAEFLAHSYFRSFDVPVVVTRTVNMFGERQHPEKFVPLVVRRLLRGEVVDIHAERGEVGSRSWLYTGEQARALAWLAEHGEPGRTYHVAAGTRRTNLEVAEAIAVILDRQLAYRLVEYAWPGHDLHYSITESSEAVHWRTATTFEEQLRRTVLWYKDNPEFLET